MSGINAPGGLSVDITVQRTEFLLATRFEAEPGRTLALVGPNGAGKSTVIGAIAGVTRVGSGRIRLAGRILVDTESGDFLPIERRRLGLVFQEGLLFPHLSVLQNVAFGIRSRGVARREAAERADEWLGRLGISRLAARLPAGLSGGQRQRVALARALAAEPDALLLDEPLAALDVRARDEVRLVLAEHLADFPGVTLLASHELADLEMLATDVLVLEHGRVSQRGSLTELRARPATAWVRRLLTGAAAD